MHDSKCKDLQGGYATKDLSLLVGGIHLDAGQRAIRHMHARTGGERSLGFCEGRIYPGAGQRAIRYMHARTGGGHTGEAGSQVGDEARVQRG